MQKYKYKKTDIQWLGEIPEHWKVDRIKDVCDKIVGGGTPKSTVHEFWDEGTIIWISPTDFSNNKGSKIISDSEKKITELGCQQSSAIKIPKGTVIMSSRASIGEAKIAGCELTTNQGFVSFIMSNKLHNTYLFYVIEGHLGKYFLGISSGTTFNEISRRMVKHEYMPLPPIKEQKSIAEYLDKACHRIDSIISIKEQQLEQIKLMRKSRIDELVCFGSKKNAKRKSTGLPYLPEINANWRFDRFKDVARLRDEKTDEKSEKEDYLELEDFEQGTGKILNKRNTLEVESKVTKFYRGDVLFGKLRPYLEKYHYADFDGKCTGEVLAFQPFKINGQYLKYILGSKWFIDLCNSMSYGAKMPRVNWTTQLASINIPLPSEEEQIEIVKSLDALSDKIYSLNKKVIDQIDNLKEYRKSIIHEYVTGKKQVADIALEKEIKRVMA